MTTPLSPPATRSARRAAFAAPPPPRAAPSPASFDLSPLRQGTTSLRLASGPHATPSCAQYGSEGGGRAQIIISHKSQVTAAAGNMPCAAKQVGVRATSRRRPTGVEHFPG